MNFIAVTSHYSVPPSSPSPENSFFGSVPKSCEPARVAQKKAALYLAHALVSAAMR